MTTAEATILRALLTRRPIGAVYQGLWRELCPHVLGTNREGRLQVLCYQFGGLTSSGPVATPDDPADGPAANWRCLVVEQLRDVRLLEPGEAPAPWYTCRPAGPGARRQTCVVEVLAVAREKSRADVTPGAPGPNTPVGALSPHHEVAP